MNTTVTVTVTVKKKGTMYIANASSFTYNYLIINNIYNIYSIKEELGGAFKNNCDSVTVTLAHSIFCLRS